MPCPTHLCHPFWSSKLSPRQAAASDDLAVLYLLQQSDKGFEVGGSSSFNDVNGKAPKGTILACKGLRKALLCPRKEESLHSGSTPACTVVPCLSNAIKRASDLYWSLINLVSLG